MAAAVQGRGEARLDVELIDVGHGDALILHWTPERGQPATILVDGGPQRGAVRIGETLKKLDATAIDLVVLSHCDADHVDGCLPMRSQASGSR